MKKRISILHVVPTLGAGGTERNCAHLVEAFGRDGEYDNTIVAACIGEGSYRSALDDLTRRPVQVLPTGRLARLRDFSRRMRTHSYDAVLFHYFNIDQAMMAILATRAGIRHIAAAAGNPAPAVALKRIKWMSSIMLNHIAGCPIISASQWIHDSISDLARLPRGSCPIHNGLALNSFRLASNKHATTERPHTRWVLGIVARLDEIKDHETLFRGIALFQKQQPEVDFELRVIGDGFRRPALEELASTLGVANKVHFLGTRLDIPQQLSDLNLFVFSTTRMEGFGNVLIEAMAAGVPVLANDVPSCREVLRQGALGTLVPAASPDAWAKALTQTWKHGPSVPPPEPAEIDALYGIDQFSSGYLDVLGLTAEQTT